MIGKLVFNYHHAPLAYTKQCVQSMVIVCDPETDSFI